MGIVISEARAARWRPNWELIAVLVADLAAWVGIVLLCVLWTHAEAAEDLKAGAVCAITREGRDARAIVQDLEPGRPVGSPWVWVAIDHPQFVWIIARVPVAELRDCKL